MTKARTDYISWDDYFMEVAILSSKRSKDPKTQVGACIANSKNHIVGTGYNGFPQQCDNNSFSWSSGEHDDPNTKYPYVVHAEPNAILNCYTSDLSDCRIYVTLEPCNECAKLIAQSGIKKVYILHECDSRGTCSAIASRRIFKASGVELYLKTDGSYNRLL